MHMDITLEKLLIPADKKENYSWLKMTRSGFQCALCLKWNSKKIEDPFVFGSKTCKQSELSNHLHSKNHLESKQLEEQLNSFKQSNSWKKELKVKTNEQNAEDSGVTPKILNVFSLAKSENSQPNPVENTIIVVNNGTLHTVPVCKPNTRMIPILPKIMKESQVGVNPILPKIMQKSQVGVNPLSTGPLMVRASSQKPYDKITYACYDVTTTAEVLQGPLAIVPSGSVVRNKLELNNQSQKSDGNDRLEPKKTTRRDLHGNCTSVASLMADKFLTSSFQQSIKSSAINIVNTTKAISQIDTALKKFTHFKDISSCSSSKSNQKTSLSSQVVVTKNTVQTPMSVISNCKDRPKNPSCVSTNVSAETTARSPILSLSPCQNDISTGKYTDDIKEDEAMEIAASLFIEPASDPLSTSKSDDEETVSCVSNSVSDVGSTDALVDKSEKEKKQDDTDDEEESEEYTASSSSSEEESSDSEYDPEKDVQPSESDDDGSDMDDLYENAVKMLRGSKNQKSTPTSLTKSITKSVSLAPSVTPSSAALKRKVPSESESTPLESDFKTVKLLPQGGVVGSKDASVPVTSTYDKINRLKLLKLQQQEAIEKLRRKQDHQSCLKTESSSAKTIVVNSISDVKGEVIKRIVTNDSPSHPLKTSQAKRDSKAMSDEKQFTTDSDVTMQGTSATSPQIAEFAKKYNFRQRIVEFRQKLSEKTISNKKKTQHITTTASNHSTKTTAALSPDMMTKKIPTSVNLTRKVPLSVAITPKSLATVTMTSVPTSVTLTMKTPLSVTMTSKASATVAATSFTTPGGILKSAASTSICNSLGLAEPLQNDHVLILPVGSTVMQNVPFQVKRLLNGSVKLVAAPQNAMSSVTPHNAQSSKTTTPPLRPIMRKVISSGRGRYATFSTATNIPIIKSDSKTVQLPPFIASYDKCQQISCHPIDTTTPNKPVLDGPSVSVRIVSETATNMGFHNQDLVAAKQKQPPVSNILIMDKGRSMMTSGNDIPISMVTGSFGSCRIAPQATAARCKPDPLTLRRPLIGITLPDKKIGTLNNPMVMSSVSRPVLVPIKNPPLQVLPHIKVAGKTPSGAASFVVNSAAVSTLQPRLRHGVAPSASHTSKVQSSHQSQNATVGHFNNGRTTPQQVYSTSPAILPINYPSVAVPNTPSSAALPITPSSTLIQTMSSTATQTSLKSSCAQVSCNYTISLNSVPKISPITVFPAAPIHSSGIKETPQSIGVCRKNVPIAPATPPNTAPIVIVLPKSSKSPGSPATINTIHMPPLSSSCTTSTHVGANIKQPAVSICTIVSPTMRELRPQMNTNAGTTPVTSSHTTPGTHFITKNVNEQNVWYIVTKPPAPVGQSTVQPQMEPSNSIMKLINLVNVDKKPATTSSSMASKSKGTSPTILLQPNVNSTNPLTVLPVTVKHSPISQSVALKLSPKTPTVPIKLGVREKLFRMTNDVQRWKFLPNSDDNNFLYLLGYEACLNELAGEYYGIRKGGVSVGFRECYQTYLKKRRRAGFKPRVAASRVKKVIEVICSDEEEEEKDEGNAAVGEVSDSSGNSIPNEKVVLSAKRGNSGGDDVNGIKRIKLDGCSEDANSVEAEVSEVNKDSSVHEQPTESAVSKSRSCGVDRVPTHVKITEPSASTSKDNTSDDITSCDAVADEIPMTNGNNCGEELQQKEEIEDSEKLDSSDSSSNSSSDLFDFRLLSPSKLNPKVIVEKMMSYTVVK